MIPRPMLRFADPAHPALPDTWPALGWARAGATATSRSDAAGIENDRYVLFSWPEIPFLVRCLCVPPEAGRYKLRQDSHAAGRPREFRAARPRAFDGYPSRQPELFAPTPTAPDEATLIAARTRAGCAGPGAPPIRSRRSHPGPSPAAPAAGREHAAGRRPAAAQRTLWPGQPRIRLRRRANRRGRPGSRRTPHLTRPAPSLARTRHALPRSAAVARVEIAEVTFANG